MDYQGLTKEQQKHIRTAMFDDIASNKFQAVIKMKDIDSLSMFDDEYYFILPHIAEQNIEEFQIVFKEYVESQFMEIRDSVLSRWYRQVKSDAKKQHIKSIQNAQLSLKRIKRHVDESVEAMERELNKVMSDRFKYDDVKPSWSKEKKE